MQHLTVFHYSAMQYEQMDIPDLLSSEWIFLIYFCIREIYIFSFVLSQSNKVYVAFQ